MAIRDIIDSNATVTLFTRPRRFGKTLFQSMLRTFFEDERSFFKNNLGEKIDNKKYFEGLKISEAGEEYLQHQGRYPVISLSLKSSKQPDFQMAYEQLVTTLRSEYKRHRYILNFDSLDDEIERFHLVSSGKASKSDYYDSIRYLSECLHKVTGQKTIILIDEYDVPLENSFARGFYDEMTDFIRSLFESALKTNDSLEFAVLTGCLRISRESIFTGLNNLNMMSVLSNDFDE